MKRSIYIVCASILGVLVSLLIHGIAERVYLSLLVRDFDTYRLGLSWTNLIMIHHVSASLLFVLGMWVGYLLGKKWWKIVYVEGRHWSLGKK